MVTIKSFKVKFDLSLEGRPVSSQDIWIREDINWVLCFVLFYYSSLDRFVECCDLLYHFSVVIFINVLWSQEKGAR